MKRMLFSLAMLIGGQDLCAQQAPTFYNFMPSQDQLSRWGGAAQKGFSQASGWLWGQWSSLAPHQQKYAMIGGGLLGTWLAYKLQLSLIDRMLYDMKPSISQVIDLTEEVGAVLKDEKRYEDILRAAYQYGEKNLRGHSIDSWSNYITDYISYSLAPYNTLVSLGKYQQFNYDAYSVNKYKKSEIRKSFTCYALTNNALWDSLKAAREKLQKGDDPDGEDAFVNEMKTAWSDPRNIFAGVLLTMRLKGLSEAFIRDNVDENIRGVDIKLCNPTNDKATLYILFLTETKSLKPSSKKQRIDYVMRILRKVMTNCLRSIGLNPDTRLYVLNHEGIILGSGPRLSYTFGKFQDCEL